MPSGHARRQSCPLTIVPECPLSQSWMEPGSSSETHCSHLMHGHVASTFKEDACVACPEQPPVRHSVLLRKRPSQSAWPSDDVILCAMTFSSDDVMHAGAASWSAQSSTHSWTVDARKGAVLEKQRSAPATKPGGQAIVTAMMTSSRSEKRDDMSVPWMP